MQDQNNEDHDLIPPDALQKSSETPAPAPASEAVEHEFGQMAKRPAKEPPVKEKKPGVLGRLFGTPKKTEPWHKHHEEPKPSSKDWTPIDLRKGPIRKGLFERNTANFRYHAEQDLKRKGFSVKERKAISGMLAKKRSGGLFSGETKKGIEGLEEFSKTKIKRAKRVLGATKGSSFF